MTQKNTSTSKMSFENIFIAYNLISYAAFAAGYWVIHLTMLEDMMFFFGSEILLFGGLMVYGLIQSLFISWKPKRTSRKHRGLSALS
jgi:intracellular septation protein A